MEGREHDGPQGGEYSAVDLSDGRALHVSRKLDDNRVWLGRPDDPKTYRGQRGGIGTISRLFDDWRSRVALDPAMSEKYEALPSPDSAVAVGSSRVS